MSGDGERSSSIPISSPAAAPSSPLPPSSPPPHHASASSPSTSARSLSRLWDRIQASSPTLPSPFASSAASEAEQGGIKVDGEPLVVRLRSSVDRLSGSWPRQAADRFVPRWGSSKERERAGRGGQRLADSEDDPLDGDEGVVVDDEACFVDGWQGKVDFLSSFPHEISLYILLHLDFNSLLTCSVVSRQWRSLAFDNVLWRDLFHQEKRWRIREPTAEEMGLAPEPRSWEVEQQPSSQSHAVKRQGSTLSRAGSKKSTTGLGMEAGSSRSATRRLTDMMADMSLTTSRGQESDRTSLTSSLDTSASPTAVAQAPTPLTPRRATAALLPTNAFAAPPSHTATTTTYEGGLSLSRSSSRASSNAALSSLASSISALPPSLGPSRRASSATLPPLGPVPSPMLRATPTAPLMGLDWPKLYHDRWLLEQRWKKGKAKSTFLKGHEDSVYCLQFDDKMVISGSRDQTIRLWDLRTSQCIKVLRGHEGSVLCLQRSARHLISGSSDSRILVWDLEGDEGTGQGRYEVAMSLVGHNMGVLDLGADEKWIVSCSKDTTIRVWHRQTGQLYRTLAGHRGPVNAVQLLNDKIVSASGDSLMKLWDVLTGEVLRVFSGHERGLACVKLSGSGRLLASGSNDKTIRIWDAATGECLKVLKGHTDLVRSLAIDEETGRVVSASYDRTVRVWDWPSAKELLNLKGHTSLVFDVDFSVDRIISSSHDQRILSMDFGDGLDTRLFL